MIIGLNFISINLKMALGASFVCSVENKMASQGGVQSYIRGVYVADFSDQNHIRILAQNGTQGGSEGVSDIRIDLALRYAVDMIFNRILDCYDFNFLSIDFLRHE